jgi:hypothetical protein
LKCGPPVWNEHASADGLSPTTGTDLTDLGARILRAARMATAVHLYESLALTSSNYRQRVAIGGAGPVPCASTTDGAQATDPGVTEDALPASATAGVEKTLQSRRPSPTRDAGDPFGGPGSPL